MLDAVVDSPPGPQAHQHSLLRSLLQTRHCSRQTAAAASAGRQDDDDENCEPATAKVLPAGSVVPRKHASGASAVQVARRRPLGRLDANAASLAASRGLDKQQQQQQPPSTEGRVSCSPPQTASTAPAAQPGRRTAPGMSAQQPGRPARSTSTTSTSSTSSTSASLADTLLAAPWQADGGVAVMQRRPGVASRAASSTCAPSRAASARGGTSTSSSTGSGASSRLSASLAGVELPLFLRMHPGVPALLRRHAAAQAAAHSTGSSSGAANPPRGQGWLRHLEAGHRQQQLLMQAAGATQAPRPAVGPLQANLMWPAGSWTQPGPLRLAMTAGAAGPAGPPERVPPARSVASNSASMQHAHEPSSSGPAVLGGAGHHQHTSSARRRLPGLACTTQAPSVPSAGTMRACHGVPPAGARLYFAPASDPCPSPGARSCSSLDDTAQSGLSYRLAAADPLRTPFAGASPDNDDDYIRQLWDVWHGHGQHKLHFEIADRRTAQESLTREYGCRPRACRRLSWDSSGEERQA